MKVKDILAGEAFHTNKKNFLDSCPPELYLFSRLHPAFYKPLPDKPVDKIDFPRLLKLALRHRLVPDLYQLTRNRPAWFLHGYREKVEQIQHKKVSRIFHQSTELINILNILNERKLIALPLKGPVLAQRLYGDAGKRFSNDLDIFIRPSDLAFSDYTLRSLGYKRINPGASFTERHYPLYAKYKKDFTYSHPGKQIQLELHWQFSSNKLLIADVNPFFSQPEALVFGGKPVPVMNREYEFFYLVLHGMMHQFFRLFWMRDLVTYARMLNDENHENIIVLAKANRLEQPYIAAWLATHMFYGIAIPDPVMNMNCHTVRVLSLLKIISGRIPGREAMNFETRIEKLAYFIKFKPSLEYKWKCVSGILHRYYFMMKF